VILLQCQLKSIKFIKMKKKNYFNFTSRLLVALLAVGLSAGISSCKKDDDKKEEEPATTKATLTIKDDGNGVGTTTWRTGNTYILDGFVFVNSGQTLTIEPGTIIKGKPGTGENASALIVARGAKINASGTAASPIIFTYEADPLDGSTPITTKGLWGGLIVLGNASLNSTPGESQIEGIPTNEPRGLYGGSNDNESSGVIKYVSIRHGGTDIGAGNEINGLTLGGVGSATIIDFIEVIANADDGIEFFGGTARVKHAITAFCGDDSYDYDEGWRGYGQFWLTIQSGDSEEGGEHDGGTDPETGSPYATPVIYNATYIGNGLKRAVLLRDNAGGQYHNSIFANWATGVDIERLADGSEYTYKRFVDGSLSFNGNMFNSIAAGSTAATIFTVTYDKGGVDPGNEIADWVASFADNNNGTTEMGLTYAAPYNVIPSTTATGIAPTNAWFDAVTYVGAFGTQNWAKGWTLISSKLK
jgi:hypothetical protein